MKRSVMRAIIKTCIKLNHSDEAHQFERGEISLGRFAEICSETVVARIEYEARKSATPLDFKVWDDENQPSEY